MDSSSVIFVIDPVLLCERFFSPSFQGVNFTGALPRSHGPWWKNLLICARYMLTNLSCSDESSCTYSVFSVHLGYYRIFAVWERNTVDQSDAVGPCVLNTSYMADLSYRGWDLIWWAQFCVPIQQWSPCIGIDQCLGTGHNLIWNFFSKPTRYTGKKN